MSRMNAAANNGNFQIFYCENCAAEIKYRYHCGSSMALIVRTENAHWICKHCNTTDPFEACCTHPYHGTNP